VLKTKYKFFFKVANALVNGPHGFHNDTYEHMKFDAYDSAKALGRCYDNENKKKLLKIFNHMKSPADYLFAEPPANDKLRKKYKKPQLAFQCNFFFFPLFFFLFFFILYFLFYRFKPINSTKSLINFPTSISLPTSQYTTLPQKTHPVPPQKKNKTQGLHSPHNIVFFRKPKR
jgi:hypothetical protein